MDEQHLNHNDETNECEYCQNFTVKGCQECEEYVDCENCQKNESMVKLDDRNLCFECVTAMNIQDMKKKPKMDHPTIKPKN
jgi:hypothetical protein